MASVVMSRDVITEHILNKLCLKHVSELTFHFKYNEIATVTAKMNLEKDDADIILTEIKKYKLVPIEDNHGNTD